jgi:hypothetical protein
VKTLIVRYEGMVRFLITNHPSYRFQKLQEQMPVRIELFGVTSAKAKDIQSRFANLAVKDTLWYRLSDDFEQYLAKIVE